MWPLNYDNTGVTVELRELVESGVNIWDFEYPVPASTVSYNGKTAKVPFDKTAFEKKIIDHYYFRQIGQETVGRWLHYFRTRIKEIMPYYVQLYEFEAKWFNVDDPLESYNLTETFEQEHSDSGSASGTASGTASRESSGDSSSTRKFSNTPQGSISNLERYMTEATQEELATGENTSESSSGTSENTSENSGMVSHTLTKRGNIGVQPLGTEVNNIREAFINIDMMVINELKDLFLQVY